MLKTQSLPPCIWSRAVVDW